MKLINNIITSAVLLLFLIGVMGCSSSTGSGGNGWHVESYPYDCSAGMIPFPPSCLSFAEVDGGFKYNGEFLACRQSIKNFTIALDDYYKCSLEKLRSIFDRLLVEVPKTYNCYIRNFDEKSHTNLSQKCSPIDVPRFHATYEADGLEYDLGVPRCVKLNGEFDFIPKYKYQIEECKQQVDIFTGKDSFKFSLDVSPAQKQYDTYLKNLKSVLNNKADDAIRKFNCLAEGGEICI
jgi:hypothetical protein